MVSDKKIKLVADLTKKIQDYPIVGLLNLENLPAQQLQTMRAMLLKNEVVIVTARKTLLQRALEGSKKEGISTLQEKMKGIPAILFSKSNPFTLYATIQKNKSEAPAKAGQEAPKEVVVKAGPTNFAPGPIISELAAVGIKTKVEDGKLAIVDDVVVAKEGDVISAKLAETLKRLDIKPMEIGLDLVAVWEDGTVFMAKQLRVDEDEYRSNFTQAAAWAINLSVETAYLTADTTETIIQKAFRDAKGLALEQNILTDLTAGEILGKVERQAQALKAAAGITDARQSTKENKEDAGDEQVKEEGSDS
jgi:large subunit ribosomal protein L10